MTLNLRQDKKSAPMANDDAQENALKCAIKNDVQVCVFFTTFDIHLTQITMKKSLPRIAVAMLFVCVTATNSLAQNKFIKPGAQWNYVFNNFFIPNVFNVSNQYIGDTIIGNDTINVIAAYYTNKNDNSCYSYRHTWIKQKGDTIYFKNNLTGLTWQILYNFATPAGQSWTTTFPPATGALNTYVVMVDSVKTVTINNIALKQLKVRYFGGPNGVESTLITERIGCHLFMFNYYRQVCSTDQPWFKEFICYKDNTLGSTPIGSKPCSYGAGLSEWSSQNSTSKIQVSPNPSKSVLKINLTAVELGTSIAVYDTFGKQVYLVDADNGQVELDTHQLANGLYSLKQMNNGLSVASVKFVVAH